MGDDSRETLRFLPVGLNVQGRKCLVVGGGAVGARKASNLLRAGAHVTIVSPAISPELKQICQDGDVDWIAECFEENHLEGAFLAVAATDDESLNQRIVQLAGECDILVCDASSAERTGVIFGALLQHEGATIAVFTEGRDPSLARKTRNKIAERLED